jgi:DNA modification methylase
LAVDAKRPARVTRLGLPTAAQSNDGLPEDRSDHVRDGDGLDVTLGSDRGRVDEPAPKLPIEEQMARDVEPDEVDAWLSIEDAASLLAVTPRRLMRVLRRDRISYRGAQRDPFVRTSALGAIRAAVLKDESSGDVRVGTSAEPDSASEVTLEADRLIVGDALAELRHLPGDLAQAVVTSPPFWGQRVYEDETAVTWADETSVAFGREETPQAYARHSAEILVELARVLKPTGTIWWNVGDAYWTRTILHASSTERINHYGGERSNWADTPNKRSSAGHLVLKDKDLSLVPFLVALEAQKAGLWLRSVIVWSKQRQSSTVETDGHNGQEKEVRAHMPEPVADRPVTGHEYILLFAKSDVYDYHPGALGDLNGDTAGPNVRTVWTFRPVDSHANHGARFPEELPRRCIALGSKRNELILDPFAGHGTTLKVAAEMGRHYLGIEVSPTYAEEARATTAAARTRTDSMLALAEV